MIVLKERFWRKLPLFCGVSVECCRVLHLMFGRVGRVGAWISMLGCALVLAYVLMEHEECEPFHSVFGFFAALQVLNSSLYFFSSLAGLGGAYHHRSITALLRTQTFTRSLHMRVKSSVGIIASSGLD